MGPAASGPTASGARVRGVRQLWCTTQRRGYERIAPIAGLAGFSLERADRQRHWLSTSFIQFYDRDVGRSLQADGRVRTVVSADETAFRRPTKPSVPDQGPPSSYKPPDLTLFGDEHVRQYRATDGQIGHEWNGARCLLLTTTGRRSGESRTHSLIYGSQGESCVVIASSGGAPRHPAWYLNLQAEPRVDVQVKADRFSATARTAEGKEREALWQLMTVSWPNYDEYTKRTDRVIPVVVLDRDPA